MTLDENVSCQRCGSHRVGGIGAKCNDLCDFNLGDYSKDGYVPDDVGIGGGDYVEFDYCLDCGQIQGQWPLPVSELEQDEDDD